MWMLHERRIQNMESSMRRPKIIGCKEAAEILGVSIQRVKKLADKMYGQKVGNSWVFFEKDVIKFSKIERKDGRPKK